jgi:hypothetical protein
MYNMAPRELKNLREIVEKVLKMHSVDCSKCYEDVQKRLELFKHHILTLWIFGFRSYLSLPFHCQ